MGKHTDGPWYICYEKYSDHAMVTSEGRVSNSKAQIANVIFANPDAGMLEPFQSEQEANARLIAASPDLLAIVERMVNYEAKNNDGVSLVDNDRLFDDAMAAIAKARGEA